MEQAKAWRTATTLSYGSALRRSRSSRTSTRANVRPIAAGTPILELHFVAERDLVEFPADPETTLAGAIALFTAYAAVRLMLVYWFTGKE